MNSFQRRRRGMSSHDTGSTTMKKIAKVMVGKSMGAAVSLARALPTASSGCQRLTKPLTPACVSASETIAQRLHTRTGEVGERDVASGHRHQQRFGGAGHVLAFADFPVEVGRLEVQVLDALLGGEQ